MTLFWDRGYEGVTLEDLQDAMGGITPPSFYAAFGSKEKLFKEAVDLYWETIADKPLRVLAQRSTARAGVEAMLRETVSVVCGANTPHGCLMVAGALKCARPSKGAEEYLARFRRRVPDVIKRRLERGVKDGDVPRSADVAALSALYATVMQGLAIRARDGASRKVLTDVTRAAMAAWEGLRVRSQHSGPGRNRSAGR
jgi:AcrR family transcriptional regulator